MKFARRIVFIFALVTPISLVVLGLSCNSLGPKNLVLVTLAKREIAKGAYHLFSLYDPWKDKNKNEIESSVKMGLDGYGLTRYELQKMLSKHNTKVLASGTSLFKKSSLPFDYQRYGDDRLRQLRDKYNLNQFIEINNDFEGFIKLKNWLSETYAHGKIPPDTTFHNFDSLEILDNKGKYPNFDCGIFSYTYVQCILSLGGQARVVLLKDSGGKGHVISEIWSNYWNKWIAVDVDHNLYYEQAKVPLNALELHNAYLDGNYGTIDIVRGPPFGKEEISKKNLEEELSMYRFFAIRMRNDFFNKYPKWHYKGNSYVNCIQWIDEKSQRLLEYVYTTNKEEDMYWDLNKTAIFFKPGKNFTENSLLSIYLQTNTPNFMYFEINIDGKIHHSHSAVFGWDIHKGKNNFEVRSVNMFGIKGAESKIKLEVF